jgi:hypothetical protein
MRKSGGTALDQNTVQKYIAVYFLTVDMNLFEQRRTGIPRNGTGLITK